MKSMNPAGVVLAAATIVMSVFALSAQAQSPRMLVGFPPGGTTDVIARIFAEKLSEATKKPVLVENRTGGSGRVAIVALKNSAADGNTMAVIPDSALTMFPHTVDKSPFQIEDFIPFGHVGSFDTGLAIGPGVPAKDLKGWIAWAKADKKNALYGSPSAGSLQHFLGFKLGDAVGVPLEHVSYNGVGPAVTSLLGGHVPNAIIPMGTLAPLAKAGKVRVLAHSGDKRIEAAPDIPTFKELGYPALLVQGWYLLIVPAGTPAQTVARYNQVVNQALKTKAVQDSMRKMDLETREMSPALMIKNLKADNERWRPVVKASGFRTTTGL